MNGPSTIDWEAKRAEWDAQAKLRRQLEDEAFEANKTALFDALANVGIVRVSVGFDGEGDQGQIEHVQAEDTHGDVALPEVSVAVAIAPFDGTELTRIEEGLTGAIETVCYAVLSSRFGGWEINDGSYGTFVFEVASRTVELTHHNRFVDVETSEHTI